MVNVKFTAPANTHLETNTTYAVRINSSNLRDYGATTSNDEDTGAATGWSIADVHHVFSTVNNNWTADSNGRSLRISIAGETNTRATGTASVAGSRRVGETLTATVSDVADADGLTDPTYTYQWVRVDGTTETDVGTDSETYMPVAADRDKDIKVVVSFTDDIGFDEELESATVLIRGVSPASCPANRIGEGRTQVWSATLTVGASKLTGTETVVLYGFVPGSAISSVAGSLSDENFDIGSNRYTIDQLSETETGTNGQLNVELDATLTSGERANLRLHVCGETYKFSDATERAAAHLYGWPNAGLDWSSATTRAVALSMPANQAPTGAPAVSGRAQAGATVTAGHLVDSRRGRPRRRGIYLPMGSGRRHQRGRHHGRDRAHLQTHGGRRRQDGQGHGLVHRRRRERRNAHERGVPSLGDRAAGLARNNGARRSAERDAHGAANRRAAGLRPSNSREGVLQPLRALRR